MVAVVTSTKVNTSCLIHHHVIFLALTGWFIWLEALNLSRLEGFTGGCDLALLVHEAQVVEGAIAPAVVFAFIVLVAALQAFPFRFCVLHFKYVGRFLKTVT